MSEKPFTITYASANEVNAGTISFECICGTSLTITKHSHASILSGTFCQKCDEQWWIRWSAGELHRGRIEQDPTSHLGHRMYVIWSDEDNAYVVSVPALPGCMTHGSTYEEALQQGKDAIESWLSWES